MLFTIKKYNMVNVECEDEDEDETIELENPYGEPRYNLDDFDTNCGVVIFPYLRRRTRI